jgi:hypothetical protein
MTEKFRPVHIVTMVIAICITAIAAPVAVYAAQTGEPVNITDKMDATRRTRVTEKGTLLVTGTDSTTGSRARVVEGKSLVGDGSGNLTMDMGAPGKPFDAINDLTLHSGDTRRPVAAGVGFRELSLTSVIASAEGSTAGSVELLVVAYVKSNSTTGDCETLSGFGAAERFTIMVPVGQTVNINWPSPLVWTQYADANDYYCINVESFGGPTGYTAHFSAYGFRND